MRTHRTGLLLAPLAAAAVVAGCGTPVAPTPPPPPSPGPTAPPSAGPAVELKAVTAAELDQAVRDRKGKVVLLDLWFLGCDPCRKAFPHTVQLHKEYADEGLACLSVDVEENELKKQDKVLDFLRKTGAAFPNYILRDSEANADAWKERIGWGPFPRLVLFDRAGNKVRVMEGPTDGEVENAVKKLLAQK